MKKTNKILAGLLSAALVAMPFASLGASPALAAAEVQPISSGVENRVFPYYFSYTGKVTAIAGAESEDANPMLTMESDEQGPANPVLTKDCFIMGGEDIKVGDTVTLYYETNRPMIMIYPPRYNAVIAVIQPAEAAEKAEAMEADLFDKELVSQSGLIKLTPGEKTEILDRDGQAYTGSLSDSLLLVFYQPDAANENIPEEVTPTKIIRLGQPEAAPAEPGAEAGIEETEDFSYTANIDTADIVVEQKIIEAPSAYVTENDVIMVPLRAIAEALGYQVTWEQDTQTVRLNSAISLEVGRDYYVYMRMAPIELGTAPQLKDGAIYVPLFYFRDVLKMNNAYFFENQVVIDNQEKMQ